MAKFKYPVAGLSNLAGQAGGGGGAVKSVQTVVFTADATNTTYTQSINSVTTANTILIVQNQGDNALHTFTVEITDSTTLTLTCSNSNTDQTVVIHVIEFSDGVINNKQTGVTTSSSTTSNDVSIGSVDTSKTVVFIAGYYNNNDSSPAFGEMEISGRVTSSTNLRLERSRGADQINIAWQVVEFA